jgi:hypothetical protein
MIAMLKLAPGASEEREMNFDGLPKIETEDSV